MRWQQEQDSREKGTTGENQQARGPPGQVRTRSRTGTPSVGGEADEGQDMRGEKRWGRRNGPDGDMRQSMKEKVQQLQEQLAERVRKPAKDWGIQGGKARNHGLDNRGQETASRRRGPWTGTSGGQRAETLDWNIRGLREWPQIGTSGAAQGGEEVGCSKNKNSGVRKNKRRKPTSARSNRANKIKIKDQDNVGGKGDEGQDERGEKRGKAQDKGAARTARLSTKETEQQQKEELGERARPPAKDWGIQGGKATTPDWTVRARKKQQGNRPAGTGTSGGPSSQQGKRQDPRLEHPGMTTAASNLAPRTGTSGGQLNETLDWNIRGRCQ